MASSTKKSPKNKTATWTDHLGYVVGVIVFGGLGLMRGMNEPGDKIALAPGLHVVAAAEQGEQVRVIARVISIEGSSVTIDDGALSAVATVTEDTAARLTPGHSAVFSCKVTQPGEALTLDC